MSKIVKLTTPVVAFGKPVAEVELLEPKGGAYFRLGDPRVPVMNASGSAYWAENPDVINSYMEVCIQHEMRGALLGLLTLDDAMEVKQAFFGFFEEAAQKRAARSLTNSSSA